MGLLLYLIRFVTNIYLLLLLARVSRYYQPAFDRSTLGQVIEGATDVVLRPLRAILPLRQPYLATIVAVTVLVLRGILYGLLISAGAHSAFFGLGFQLSFVQFVCDSLWVLVVALFLGLALLRAGGYYSNFGLRLLEEWTRWSLLKTRRVMPLNNSWGLYALTVAWIALVGSCALSLVTLSPAFIWHLGFIPLYLELMALPLWVLSAVLFIFILISWFSPDPYNPVYQVLETVARPSLDWGRRVFYWARIDMFDLSPMIVLLLLYCAQSALYSGAAWASFQLGVETFGLAWTQLGGQGVGF